MRLARVEEVEAPARLQSQRSPPGPPFAPSAPCVTTVFAFSEIEGNAKNISESAEADNNREKSNVLLMGLSPTSPCVSTSYQWATTIFRTCL